MNKTCAIVDGYKFSKKYAAAFKKRGLDCIYIQSTENNLENFNDKTTYDADDYVAYVIFDGDINKLIDEVKGYDIVCVVPGTEPGVILADTLSEQLGIISNGAALSPARRNKYLMMDALRQCDLETVEYFKSSDFNEIYNWTDIEKLWPVVLKPVDSSCSDGVFICNSRDELQHAFDDIKGATNIHNIKNEEVLAQRYIEGDEYIVNTVSCQGSHYITDICAVKKRTLNKYHKIYDTESLIPFNGDIQDKLVDYVCKSLDALGISFGAAHTEVMFTKNTPLLIETAGRISGCINQQAHVLCLGRDPFDIAVDSYIDPKQFFRSTDEPYQIKKHTMQVALFSEITGELVDIPMLTELKRLPSFYSVDMFIQLGDFLKETKNYYAMPGKVTLIHENKSVMENDYITIKGLQKTGFVVK